MYVNSGRRRFGRSSEPAVLRGWYEKNNITETSKNRERLSETEGAEKNTPLQSTVNKVFILGVTETEVMRGDSDH